MRFDTDIFYVSYCLKSMRVCDVYWRNFFKLKELKKKKQYEFYHACNGLHAFIGRQAFTNIISYTDIPQYYYDDNDDFSLVYNVCVSLNSHMLKTPCCLKIHDMLPHTDTQLHSNALICGMRAIFSVYLIWLLLLLFWYSFDSQYDWKWFLWYIQQCIQQQ